jgi:hypothetical protein
MLLDLKNDADGGLTIYLQSISPGAEFEVNWLPAPGVPFCCWRRTDWPKKRSSTVSGCCRLWSRGEFPAP